VEVINQRLPLKEELILLPEGKRVLIENLPYPGAKYPSGSESNSASCDVLTVVVRPKLS
jgi:hypothetical protein